MNMIVLLAIIVVVVVESKKKIRLFAKINENVDEERKKLLV